MIGHGWLLFGLMLYSLQLNTGSFPKPLSEAEERRCLQLAKQGDLEARNTLIEHNLRLVAHIMKKYYAQTADQEDLISIGTIGLIKGITTFNPDKGARLATYAARCVENATLSPMRLVYKGSGLWKPGGGRRTGWGRSCISVHDLRTVCAPLLSQLQTAPSAESSRQAPW